MKNKFITVTIFSSLLLTIVISPVVRSEISLEEMTPNYYDKKKEDVNFSKLKSEYYDAIIAFSEHSNESDKTIHNVLINPFESISIDWIGIGERKASIKMNDGTEIKVNVATNALKLKYFIDRELNQKLHDEIEHLMNNVKSSQLIKLMKCEIRDFESDYVLDFSKNTELIKYLFCKNNQEPFNKKLEALNKTYDILRDKVNVAFDKMMPETCFTDDTNKYIEKVLKNHNDMDGVYKLLVNPDFKQCIERLPELIESASNSGTAPKISCVD